MIVLPPLGAPKRHMITHHCIEITNNKTSTACRCHRRRGSRGRCCCGCRCGGSVLCCSCSCAAVAVAVAVGVAVGVGRRNVAVNERGALLSPGRNIEESGNIVSAIEGYESGAVAGSRC